MSVPEPTAHITSNYMARFQCIGSACEDHCCSGWVVDVDEEHYEFLRAKMSQTPQEQEEFRRNLKLRTPSPTWERHAEVQHQANGDCSFLTAERLCSIHGRYGAEALSNTCAQFPRLIRQTGARRELWGDLSCPEVARLCLLAEDGMEIVDGAADASQRLITGFLPADPTKPYAAYLDDVRATVYRILSQRQHPMSIRLLLVSYFANRIGDFFHQDASTIDEARLGQEMRRMQDPELLDTWAKQASRLPTAPDVPITFLAEIIKSAHGDSRLGPLITAALDTYTKDRVVVRDHERILIENDRLWAAYEARKLPWEQSFGDRIDLYFENHSKNFWMCEWYVAAPNLMEHAANHLVRTAMIRFLFFSHPTLLELATSTARDERQAALDGVVVQAVYKFCRAIEHSKGVLDRIRRALTEKKMLDFAHSAILARV